MPLILHLGGRRISEFNLVYIIKFQGSQRYIVQPSLERKKERERERKGKKEMKEERKKRKEGKKEIDGLGVRYL